MFMVFLNYFLFLKINRIRKTCLLYSFFYSEKHKKIINLKSKKKRKNLKSKKGFQKTVIHTLNNGSWLGEEKGISGLICLRFFKTVFYSQKQGE